MSTFISIYKDAQLFSMPDIWSQLKEFNIQSVLGPSMNPFTAEGIFFFTKKLSSEFYSEEDDCKTWRFKAKD